MGERFWRGRNGDFVYVGWDGTVHGDDNGIASNGFVRGVHR